MGIDGTSNNNNGIAYLFGSSGTAGSASNNSTGSANPQEIIKDILDIVGLSNLANSNNPLLNQDAIKKALTAAQDELKADLQGQGTQSGSSSDPLGILNQLARGGGGAGIGSTGSNGSGNQLNELMQILANNSGRSGSYMPGSGNSNNYSNNSNSNNGMPNLANLLGAIGAGTSGGNSVTHNNGSSTTSNGLNNVVTNSNVNNVTVSSTGDPHLAFNINGTTYSHDNNGSQNDLFDANRSFTGGYQVSTEVTAPDANGKTYNGKVGVHVDNVDVKVSHNASGAPTVTVTDASGSQQTLSKGQTITTKDGATIGFGQDGKVQVTDNNSTGGTVSTSISDNGHGLDVASTGRNVTIGGFEAAYAQRQMQTSGQTMSQTQVH